MRLYDVAKDQDDSVSIKQNLLEIVQHSIQVVNVLPRTRASVALIISTIKMNSEAYMKEHGYVHSIMVKRRSIHRYRLNVFYIIGQWQTSRTVTINFAL